MKTIIIFGATGKIGIYLTEYLYSHLNKKEYKIIAVGKRETNYFNKYGIDYFSVDISKKYDFDVLPKENIFAVIHLAGILPAAMEGYNPEKYIETNILGTLNILEYCRYVHSDRILFTKSVFDYYGYLPDTRFLKADMPKKIAYTGDHSVYAISKVACQELIEHYYQEYGLKRFVFRLPNIYMYSPQKYYYVSGEKRIISYRYMINRAIEGLDIELWGDPEKGKDFIYIKDFCQIIMKSILADIDGGEYNVGSGVITTMKEQIEGIIKVFSPDMKSKIIYCPEKKSCNSLLLDISKTKLELGYEPKYDYISYLNDYKKEMNSNRFENV